MASTFSPTLRLELIGDGDQSGIWGQTTNTNLGALLEQAITGVQTITMTDANYTLTSFNGVVDEARNAVLIFTGTLSQQRNVIAPLVEKIYTIKNNTTGGFGIQIIGASGTGVVIPNGVTASVYCDGTNFNPLQVNSIGNQTINGNLAVTGTTSLTGNLTASTATFSGTVALGGTPTAPTAAPGTNTTQIATTAYVQNITSGLGTMSQQNANNVAITGGSINSTALGSAVTGVTQAVTTNNTSLATTAFVRSIIPAGVILMWSGSVASIPSGWFLCNGANGTPDLRDRFIVGAGSSYNVNDTGGNAFNTLSTAQLPSHTHSVSASGTTSIQSNGHTHTFGGTTGGMNSNTTHSHSATDSGHTHASPKNAAPNGGGAGICFAGAASGNSPGYDTTTGFANISVGSANIDHTHNYSGTTSDISANHTHTVTVSGTSGATGSGSAIDNRPPFYALCYIMKA